MRRRYNPHEVLTRLPDHFVQQPAAEPDPGPELREAIDLRGAEPVMPARPRPKAPSPKPPPPPPPTVPDVIGDDDDDVTTHAGSIGDGLSHPFGSLDSRDLADTCSTATTAFSVFIDDDEFEHRIRRQLDFASIGGLFDSLFEKMPPDERRRVGRIARLQVVQKRKWLYGVWRAFDSAFTEDQFLATMKVIAGDDRPAMNGLLESALAIVRRFFWVDSWGICSNVRGFICGPRFGGKTTLLRTLFLQLLALFANTGMFKNVFIVSLDFRKATVGSAEDFFRFIANAVLGGLLCQRADVALFEHSLTSAFTNLLTVSRLKKLPKPLSSQDYLRRPMRMVDQVLSNLHQLYNEPRPQEFVEQICSLPQTIGRIFGFSSTFLVVDHIDLIGGTSQSWSVSGKPFNPSTLRDLMNRAIDGCQFLVSAVGCKGYSTPGWNLISVADTCQSAFQDRYLTVSFITERVADLKVDSQICGGCPTFVGRYDDICNLLVKRAAMIDAVQQEEHMIIAVQQTEIFLDLVLSFGDAEEDGGPPRVREVRLRPKQEPAHDEYSDST
jgi:hypothetical protein